MKSFGFRLHYFNIAAYALTKFFIGLKWWVDYICRLLFMAGLSAEKRKNEVFTSAFTYIVNFICGGST